MGDTDQLGRVIAARRKELGITQEELAELAGISTRSVSVVENGKATTRLSSIIAVADALGLDLNLDLRGARASR